MARRANKEHFSKPEDLCEPLKRQEYDTVLLLFSGLDAMIRAKEGALVKRINEIPYGHVKLNLATGLLTSLMNDLMGATPVNQLRKIRNASMDLEVRMIPKMTPGVPKLLLDKDDAKTMVDYSRTGECCMCVKDPDERRTCVMYKTLCSLVPLGDYDEDSGICPYAVAEWRH